MAYTFIVLRTDRTDKGSKTFTLSRGVLFFLISLVMFAPSVTYYLAYYVMAPNYLVKDAKIFGEQVELLTTEVESLKSENEQLKVSNDLLKAEGITAREQLGEINTRIEIAEKARSTTSLEVQELEEKNLDLERRLAFYEKFVTPDVDEEILQCFNISVKHDDNDDTLKYGINFLKKNQDDDSRMKTTVKMKVLYGSSVLSLNEDTSYQADREVRMDITKDRRLTGTLSADVPSEGLHILDIKAYSEDNKVIAHCWKPF